MYTNIRTFLCLFFIGVLSACASNSGDSSGGILDVAKRITGLGEPTPSKTEPREVMISLRGTPDLNSSGAKGGLALVVRVYALKDGVAFFQTGRDVLENPASAESLSQQDIVTVKEVVVIPGQKLAVNEKVEARTTHIGISGFFRDTASTRWRLAVPIDSFKPGKPVEVIADVNGLCVVPSSKSDKKSVDPRFCKTQ